MDELSSLFPPLPAPRELLGVGEVVTYPAPIRQGQAKVVQILAEGGAVIAVVSNHGDGVNVVNAAEHLHAHLRGQTPADVDLHVIEHWPAGTADASECFDRVVLDARGVPVWDRLYPTGDCHPRRGGYQRFMTDLRPLLNAVQPSVSNPATAENGRSTGIKQQARE